jgi:DNA helicase-2/ATP-dependent DNA helicase PcrA
VHSLQERLARLGAEQPGANLVGWIRRLLEEVDYRAEVDRCYPDPATREERWSGVLEVLDYAENHVRRAKKPGLASFLEALALQDQDRKDKDKESKRDAVMMMTLHAAKGLEFPRVYLIGVEEGILPHGRSVAEDTVEEERRLMYVGITRAQRHLTVSVTKTRSKFGTRVESHASRFLYEMIEQPPPKGWRAAGAKEGAEGAAAAGSARPGATKKPTAKGGTKGRGKKSSGPPRSTRRGV